MAAVYTAWSATVAAGGSGYSVGDVLTLVGGTGDASRFMVVTAVGGAVTSVGLGYIGSYHGKYSVNPGNPVTTTGGGGTGCTLAVNWLQIIGDCRCPCCKGCFCDCPNAGSEAWFGTDGFGFGGFPHPPSSYQCVLEAPCCIAIDGLTFTLADYLIGGLYMQVISTYGDMMYDYDGGNLVITNDDVPEVYLNGYACFTDSASITLWFYYIPNSGAGEEVACGALIASGLFEGCPPLQDRGQVWFSDIALVSCSPFMAVGTATLLTSIYCSGPTVQAPLPCTLTVTITGP